MGALLRDGGGVGAARLPCPFRGWWEHFCGATLQRPTP